MELIFSEITQYHRDIDPEALENIQKRSVNIVMDEMVRAMKGPKDGKATGGDGIPAEVWKYWGAKMSNRLHRWITQIWEKGHVPLA